MKSEIKNMRKMKKMQENKINNQMQTMKKTNTLHENK